MNDDQKSVLDSAIDWFAVLGEGLRTAVAQPTVDETGEAESDQATDPDFEGWLVSAPMVTMNPTSRYGDDATGFLAGSELENPELGRTDD